MQNTNIKLVRFPYHIHLLTSRIQPDVKTFPTPQHPETALLASATPSPMTPSEDKVPRMDLDTINNNALDENLNIASLNKINNSNCSNNKFQIRASKLPILSKAVLSPTSTPRNSNRDDGKVSPGAATAMSLSSSATPASMSRSSTSGSITLQRNLTRTVARQPARKQMY